MKIEVIDKETGKIVWIENHPTETELSNAMKDLKENTFNPDYFIFKINKA